MKVELLEGKKAYQLFKKFEKKVYDGNVFYRGTEASIEHLILDSASAFKEHSKHKMFIIRDGNDAVARFALIHDYHLKEYVQVSFFEAMDGLGKIYPLIKKEIIKHFPGIPRVVVGLNGHLNYGAGILLNRFDEVPLFGLPYNHEYYANYFSELSPRKMVTFRFDMIQYNKWAQQYPVSRKIDGLELRFMNKKRIMEESRIYTYLNNQAFVNHPYWAKREIEEDQELLYPFRFLLENENLIIAEMKGEPVGFFLWYPDFNQLVNTHKDLGVLELLKYKLGAEIDTFRFTEIGIIPKYQNTTVAWELTRKSLLNFEKKGYKYCEAGFIFEENRASLLFVKRMMKRAFGKDPEPYRYFATFEDRVS